MSDLFSSSPLARLASHIRHVEEGGSAALRVSTGLAALDRLLPGGGLARGTLVEWLAAEAGEAEAGEEVRYGEWSVTTPYGSKSDPTTRSATTESDPATGCQGATTLALLAAREACRDGQALVVLDRRRRFYPLAAAAWGVNLARMVLVRPPQPDEELWALDQALRCRGVGAVLAWPERLPNRVFRRLQWAARAGGTLGCLVRPIATEESRPAVSWADVRWRIEPQAGTAGMAGRRLLVRLLRCRGRPLTDEVVVSDPWSEVRARD